MIPNVKIRCLNEKDLALVSSVHVRAFSGRALAELGQEAVRRYYLVQMQRSSNAVCLGLFQDDILAGFCFAGMRDALSFFLRENKWFLIWRIVTHPWLMFSSIFRERIFLVLRILGLPRSVLPAPSTASRVKSFGILSIAVDPQYQGLGIGKQLMLEAEKVALERGFRRMHLTVDVNNTNTIGFYEGLGWEKSSMANNIWRGSMIKIL